MGDGIAGPVRRQQEAVDARNKRISLGGGPKLEEVEQRECEEEERNAPDGA